MSLSLFIAAAAMGQLLPDPESSPVFIHRDISEAAARELVGRGVPLPGGGSGRMAHDASGNEIAWREIRTDVDGQGGRHVFYRQYLIGRGIEAELFGSEIGVHYSASGDLRYIGGRQFTSVAVSNRPAFTAAQAVARALQRLRSHPGFRPEPLADLTPSMRAYRAENTRLKLVQSGTTFRYAYFTFANDEHGVGHDVVIDAQSEEILTVSDATLQYNCNPTEPWRSVSARGIPVRPELSTVRRVLRANVAPDRSPFTHEGFYYTTPTISALQETNNSAFACGGITPAYSLFPLSVDGATGYPTYRDLGEWHGSAAGDAMHHTYQTMQALKTLGRNGWDNRYGDANIVIDSTYLSNPNNVAYFRMSGGGDPRLPPTPVVGIGPAVNFYSNAASLDVVAHEWGHGVIMTSANFPTTTSLGLQLHEGVADVIGQAVEKLRQGSGTGLERSSDWTLHEDNGTSGYARGALDDGTAGHRWYGLNGASYLFDDKLHRDDEPVENQAHARGNMLNVVFRLLTEGGRNPICTRLPALSGCTTTVSGQGVSKAAKILFTGLVYYTPSSARWEDLATYVSWAAFDLYNQCYVDPARDAWYEQEAVHVAFNVIGYPRIDPPQTCW